MDRQFVSRFSFPSEVFVTSSRPRAILAALAPTLGKHLPIGVMLIDKVLAGWGFSHDSREKSETVVLFDQKLLTKSLANHIVKTFFRRVHLLTSIPKS